MTRLAGGALALLFAGGVSAGCGDDPTENARGEPPGLGGEAGGQGASANSGGHTATGGLGGAPIGGAGSGGTSGSGGSVGSGGASGGSPHGPGGSMTLDPDDPCGVRGTWANGCPVATLCGSCDGKLNLAYEFDIPAEIAKYGGQFISDGALLTFTTETCTLSVNANYCTPWTNDVFILRNGKGSGTGHAHCRDQNAACECASEVSCSPAKTAEVNQLN